MSPLTEIYRYWPISTAIATSGQPTTAQFTAIRDAGYTVVINLALPTSNGAIANEAKLVAALGLTYIAIPVEWEHPQPADLEQFFMALNTYADQKIFVHCAANMRVSAFMYLYRVLQQQVNPEVAAASLHQIWTPNETWQQFIESMIALYDNPRDRNN